MKHGNSNTGRLPSLRIRLRELQGSMSTTDFAKKLDLSRQTVGFYLNGERIPDSETLIKICTRCNVSADWLLGIETEELGLSQKAIHNILTIQKDEDRADYLIGLNMLLEDIRFFFIAKDIKRFADTIKIEKQFALDFLDKNYDRENNIHDRDTYLSLNDDEVADQLMQELKKAHPNLANRISVSCGRSALDSRLRSITEDFKSNVEWITGYMKYWSAVTFGRSDLD